MNGERQAVVHLCQKGSEYLFETDTLIPVIGQTLECMVLPARLIFQFYMLQAVAWVSLKHRRRETWLKLEPKSC